jgi:IS5 family transposase
VSFSEVFAHVRERAVRLVFEQRGLRVKQTYGVEGRYRRKAGGYAHAKQFKRLRKIMEW